MSHELISRSPDLKHLQDEGYNLEIKSGYLLVKDVPYVNSNKEVKYGTLVSKLDLAGNVTKRPDNHVVNFIGDHPCESNGSPIERIRHGSQQTALAEGIVVNHSFSAKPPNGYENYYHKMTTYIEIISGRAQAIDPMVTPKTFRTVRAKEDESVFKYIDTASSRCEINIITKKLELDKIAIIGLGGTGSYVLDLVAKTPVKEIHLFDGDKFLQHNAFRSPGAPLIEELEEQLHKTVYFHRIYSKMRWGIFSHPDYIVVENVNQLDGMNFVFLCIDKGSVKKLVVEKLEELSIPFIDVGMGVQKTDDSLCGTLTVTTSTPTQRQHFRSRVSFSDDDGKNEYNSNIQIADLNALNAALAVIKWKKLFGFYHDLEKEHFCAYTVDGNHLLNEERL